MQHRLVRSVLFLAAAAIAVPSFAAVDTIDVRPNNTVQAVSGSPEILIPAAGNVQGANGTHFRSEINVLNYTNRTQRVRMQWLPVGFTSDLFPAVFVDIPAFSGIGSEDFVPEVLRIPSGLGAILISAVTANGDPDVFGRLYASARIWTPQAGMPSGNVSQSFPTVATNEINSQSVSLIGMRRDAQYRFNMGIVNLSSTPQTFQIISSGSANPTRETGTLTVGPMQAAQFPFNGAFQTAFQVVVTNTTAADTRSNKWVAYGSSVDNVTGDGWSELGFTPFIAPQ